MVATHAVRVVEGQSTKNTVRADSVAVKAMSRIFKAWKVGATEAARLAGVSERTWARMKSETWSGLLSDDQKVRASAIVGVYKGLHLYFGDELADKWVKMPNKGPVFEGDAPIAFMSNGGIPAILEVREYIDAIRGGV